MSKIKFQETFLRKQYNMVPTVFCDCGFHSACPLMHKDKRLMEASWWETVTEAWKYVLVY